MSGPWEQFQSSGRVVHGGGPWMQFQKPTGPPSSFAGVDFTAPREQIRASIAKLPEAHRKVALDAWANHFVANEFRGSAGIAGVVEDGVRSFARGTPIGSWLDEANAKTVGFAHQISQGAIGAPEDEVLAYERARNRRADETSPKTSLGLKLAGGVASALATRGAAAPFQAMSMLQKMRAGSVAGAGYGTLYGAGEGEDTEGRITEGLKGMALGAGLGAAIPLAGRGISNAAQYVGDKYRSIPNHLQQFERGAIDRVVRAMGDDQLYVGGQVAQQRVPPPPTGRHRLYGQQVARMGDDAMLADMGPNLTNQSQAVATQPGAGMRTMIDALENRARGAGGRIASGQDDALGLAQNLLHREDAVMATSRRNAQPHYDQFHATPIRPTEELISILHAVPPSVWARAQVLAQADRVDLRQILNTGRGMDIIKRGLDDMAGAAQPGSNEQRVYGNLARALRTEVDEILSPGNPAASPWARARHESGEGLRYREALEMGQGALRRDPHEVAAEVRGLTPPAADAYREGMRSYLRRVSGRASLANASPDEAFAAATAARKELGSIDARQNVRTIMGAQPPGSTGYGRDPQVLFNRMDAESRFANTRYQVWGGPQTAARTAAQKEFPSPTTRTDAANEVGKKSMGGMAAEAVYRTVNALLGGHMSARQAAVIADAARMLSAQGATRDQIAHALIQYGRGRAVSMQGRNAIERLANDFMRGARPLALDGPAQERQNK